MVPRCFSMWSTKFPICQSRALSQSHKKCCAAVYNYQTSVPSRCTRILVAIVPATIVECVWHFWSRRNGLILPSPVKLFCCAQSRKDARFAVQESAAFIVSFLCRPFRASGAGMRFHGFRSCHSLHPWQHDSVGPLGLALPPIPPVRPPPDPPVKHAGPGDSWRLRRRSGWLRPPRCR